MAESTVAKAKGAAGTALSYAWSATKWTAIGTTAFAAVSFTGGSAALAAVAAGQAAPTISVLPTMALEGLAESTSFVASHIANASNALGVAAAGVTPSP